MWTDFNNESVMNYFNQSVRSCNKKGTSSSLLLRMHGVSVFSDVCLDSSSGAEPLGVALKGDMRGISLEEIMAMTRAQLLELLERRNVEVPQDTPKIELQRCLLATLEFITKPNHEVIQPGIKHRVFGAPMEGDEDINEDNYLNFVKLENSAYQSGPRRGKLKCCYLSIASPHIFHSETGKYVEQLCGQFSSHETAFAKAREILLADKSTHMETLSKVAAAVRPRVVNRIEKYGVSREKFLCGVQDPEGLEGFSKNSALKETQSLLRINSQHLARSSAAENAPFSGLRSASQYSLVGGKEESTGGGFDVKRCISYDLGLNSEGNNVFRLNLQNCTRFQGREYVGDFTSIEAAESCAKRLLAHDDPLSAIQSYRSSHKAAPFNFAKETTSSEESGSRVSKSDERLERLDSLKRKRKELELAAIKLQIELLDDEIIEIEQQDT